MERVAVIGLGNIACRHRRNLKHLYPKAMVYAMSSSGRAPVEAINDCDELVSSLNDLINNQVQLVIVASPSPFHACHAITLIEAGIPVLIEKPVTASITDSQAIQVAIEKHGTAVAVGYCLRYLSSSIEMKRCLEKGIIGQLYHASIEIGQYLPDWRPTKNYRDCVSAVAHLGGGALLELSHELDYARWLLGPLTLQHAILRASEELGLDVEDSADIMVTTESGMVTSIHLDFLQRQAYRRCRFVGSQGALEWDLIRNEIVFVSAAGTETLYSAPEWDKNQMYLTMVTDFVSKVQGGQSHSLGVDEAMHTVKLIEQIKTQHPLNLNR